MISISSAAASASVTPLSIPLNHRKGAIQSAVAASLCSALQKFTYEVIAS